MNKELAEILIGFKRALKLLDRPEKVSLIFASIIMLITGVLTNLPALILGKLTDKLVGTQNIQFALALPFIGLIIIIILIREALTVLRKYLVENVATQTDKKETVEVVEHLLKTDIAVINKQQIGALHGRVFRAIQGLVRVIKLGFLEFLPIFFSALAAIIIALTQKPLLASVMVLVIPSGLYIILKQVSSQKGIRVALLRTKEKIDGAVVEMLTGLETIRVLDTAHEEVKKVEEVAESSRQKEIRHHISMAIFDAVKYLNEGFFYILVISLSILLAAQGIISKGDILVYSILFLSITGPLREIHRILDQAHESSILVNDLYSLLNEPTDISFRIPPPSQHSRSNTEIPNSILNIKSLSFAYPENSHQLILNNITLSVKPGEKIGIVSSSGGGKTTLVKILLRLVHDYKGQVYLFSKDLTNISREEISQKIAYVPQKTYIFSGTIRDNITYGCGRKAAEQEIIRAAKQANIYQEIIHSLGGLDGVVDEAGNNLSGGQKQRLALARLILTSPELFIFDEATSALDNTNESIIQKNIERLFKNKTTITIAHRLTTLKKSDRILVFDQGKIVQEGNFNELADKKGLFKDLLEQREKE